jgi:hypothetical protein
MAQTAIQSWNNDYRLMDYDRVPQGVSRANGEISERGTRSIEAFYALSATLRRFVFPFALDTVSVVERGIQETLKDTLTKIQQLLTLDVGWNSYDALAPNPEAVLHSEIWIKKLFLEVADLGRPWMKPNVIADANGDVVFEWWYGKKKLTIYIEDESAEYVQVWGTDVHSEMLDGDAESISMCRSLWLWLTS